MVLKEAHFLGLRERSVKYILQYWTTFFHLFENSSSNETAFKNLFSIFSQAIQDSMASKIDEGN
jgi:hypothetical protein